MLFSSIVSLLSLCTIALSQQSADVNALLSQFEGLYGPATASLEYVPVPTRLGNVDPPPTSLWMAIFTGVPQSVIPQLIDPAGRASIASEFDAGNTPQWYLDLPTPVREYIEGVHEALKTGGYDYTPPAATATATGRNNGGGDVVQGGAEPSEDAAGGRVGGVRPSSWEMGFVAGVVGILGLAIGL